jgi:hypothetical protein
MSAAFGSFWDSHDHGNGIKVKRLKELLKDQDLYHGRVKDKLKE